MSRKLIYALFLLAFTAKAALAAPSATLGALDIEPPLDRFVPGETVRFTAVLSTEQPSSGVRYTAEPPQWMRLEPGTVTTTRGTVATGNDPGDASVVVDVGDMPNNTSATISYDFEILGPLSDDVTELFHQAIVSGIGFQPVATDSDGSTPGAQPERVDVSHFYLVEVAKVDADATGNGFAGPGEVIHYTTEVSLGEGTATTLGSLGAYELRTLEHAELVPGTVTTSFGTVLAGNEPGDTSVRVSLEGLRVLSSATIEFDARTVTPLPPAATEVVAAGYATTRVLGETPSDDPDAPGLLDATRTPIGRPDLVLTKSDGGVTADAGEVVSYTLGCSNAGTHTAAGVVLEETVPAHTRFEPGSSALGWSCAGGGAAGQLCTLQVGDLEPGAGVSPVFAVRIDDFLPAGVEEILNAASAQDDGVAGPDPTPGDNRAEDTTPLGAGTAPDLVVTKSDGGGVFNAGEVVTYQLTYQNVGTQGATGVVLTETVPLHTRFEPAAGSPGWSCTGSGGPGDVCTLPIGSLVSNAAPGASNFAVRIDGPIAAGVDSILNVVTIADDGTNGADLEPADNQAQEETPLGAGTAPDLTLEKSDGGASAAPGEVVVYVLSYSNLGQQDATGVVLTETVPEHSRFEPGASEPGWSCAGSGGPGDVCTLAIGSVPANDASTDAHFAVRIDSPLAPGVDAVLNTANVTDDAANGDDLDPADNEASEETPITAFVDLEVRKDDAGLPAAPGQALAYEVTVRNLGDRIATGVVLTERVPLHTAFDDGFSSPEWSCQGGGGPGELCTLEIPRLGTVPLVWDFVVKVDEPLPSTQGCLFNEVSVTDDGAGGPDTDPANNRATETTAVGTAPCNTAPGPDLGLALDDGGVTAEPGEVVTYQATFSNNSPFEVTGVVLSASVPQHTRLEASAGDPGWQCAGGGGAGDVCTLAVGAMAPTASGVASLAVRVDDPLAQGVDLLSLTATITDDGSSGPDARPDDNTATETTPVTGSGPSGAPDLHLVKDDGGITARPGQVLVYTLGVSNEGDAEASGVVLHDTLPAHTVFEAAASDPDWACPGDGTRCSIDLGTLAPGAGVSIALAVLLDDPLPLDLPSVLNEAEVEDDGTHGPDANPDDNRASVSTPLDARQVVDIPTLDGIGLGVLIAGLAAVGWRQLRRREARA